MVTPANSTVYSYENSHDRSSLESDQELPSQRPMIGDLPRVVENQSASNQEAPSRNDLSSTTEAIKKYVVELFSMIGPFACLAIGFIASGTVKLLGSIIKVQVDQLNIAAQQQIQLPHVQQPQEVVQTVHRHQHEHHVYHHYLQERRRSFSVPTCDRMTSERWRVAHFEGIVC